MIRTDPSPLSAPLPPRVPAWALAAGPVSSDADAAFCAGAALTSLENLVRSEPPWAGAWRQRLALKCAVAAVRLAGRGEDETALRDAWYLRPFDGDPGPAGTILAAWRQLASRAPVIDAMRLAEVVELLGLRWDDAFTDLLDVVDHSIRSDRPAPFAAATVASQFFVQRPDAELLCWWLADVILAQKLRWPKPAPLLMAQVFGPTFRADGARGGGARIRPGGEGFERAVCVAVAQGAADACRLAGEIQRRAERLAAVAPKLRAKGAAEAIAKLLDDDAVPGSLVTKNLSRFGSRRLFDRLMEFEAVRELSGRPAFRLYGL